MLAASILIDCETKTRRCNLRQFLPSVMENSSRKPHFDGFSRRSFRLYRMEIATILIVFALVLQHLLLLKVTARPPLNWLDVGRAQLTKDTSEWELSAQHSVDFGVFLGVVVAKFCAAAANFRRFPRIAQTTVRVRFGLKRITATN